MYDHDFIARWVESAMYVADTVLGLKSYMTTEYISNTSLPFDGICQASEGGLSTLIINEPMITPMPVEMIGTQESYAALPKAEKAAVDKMLFIMKICYIVFHEMRHVYQRDVVHAFTANPAGRKMPESAETCGLWKSELDKCTALESRSEVLEQDAEDFACYMISRYPESMPVNKADWYLKLAEKYDRVKIPPQEMIDRVVNQVMANNASQTSAGNSVHVVPAAVTGKIGRNDLCPCGSGKKYKKCCGKNGA